MDVEQFRIRTLLAVEPPPRPTGRVGRGRCQEPFLRGPIPISWLTRAFAARGSVVAAGLCLWFMRGVAPTQPDIKVTKAVRKRLGLSSDQMRRGLAGLEVAGLVEFVSRGRGRCPIVRILIPSTAAVVSRHDKDQTDVQTHNQ